MQLNGLAGKRFIFACLAIVCVTVTTMWLKFTGDIYLKLVGLISSIFTFSQAYTDVKEKKGGQV